MDLEFIGICIRLICSLGAVLLLIFIMFKLFGGKVNDINDRKYMKILDRMQVTKECSLVIIKVGEKVYLMSSSTKGLEKIDELCEEEVEIIQNKKQESLKEIQGIYSGIFDKIKGNKGEKHEN